MVNDKKPEDKTSKNDLKTHPSKKVEDKTSKNDVAKLNAQRARWKQKYKESQGKLDALESKTLKSDTSDVLSEAKDYARLIASGYQDEEIAFLERNRQKGQTILEVEKDPYVKGGIETLRAEKKVEQATPNPSSGSVKVDKKTWGEMSPEERRKNFEKHKTVFRRKS